jgi:hypothetical protein
LKRRTRHLLILIGVPLLMTLAIAGWIVDGARMPLARLRHNGGQQRPQPAGKPAIRR